MAHEIASMKVSLNYCVETTSGTRPTAGYTKIPGVKSIPNMNGSVNSIQVTDLSDEWHRYISGVKDVGGILEFTANLTTDLETAWSTLKSAAEAAAAENKSVWFEIKIPNFKSFYFAGMPNALGFGGAEVDTVLETTLQISSNQIHGFDTAST